MFRFRTNPELRAPLTAGGSSTFGYLLAAGVGLVVALFVLMAFSASRGGAATLPPCPDTLPCLYSLPGDALYPEGIAADNESGVFYVSSVFDGSIYRGNVSSPDAELFLRGGPKQEDGRTSATGLKLDDGRLFVAGAGTGKVFIYDTSSKKPVLIRSFGTKGAFGFLNDVTVNPPISGDAYITDSFVPTLWRVPAEKIKDASSVGKLEPWLDLTGTPIEYKEDGSFNLNGIVATPDGRYLLTVQSNTGKLFRIDTRTETPDTEKVREINLGGATLTQGDGLVLTGKTLYVIRNQGFTGDPNNPNDHQGFITKISFDDETFESGHVVGNTLVPIPEDFPTTGALVRGRLLVVNSQFNEGFLPGTTDKPEIPFTVSAMPAP